MSKVIKFFGMAIILIFLLAMQTVGAISMGTVVKTSTAKIEPGESARFTILFWNVEDTSYNVELDVKETPTDWMTIIQPEEFTLNSSTGREYISLPYTDKIVKVFPVDIFVKPENSTAGRYYVTIIARAGLPSQGLSFFQEREFKLTIDVAGLQPSSQAENKTNLNTDESQALNNKSSAIPHYFFYIAVIVCILVVSLIIYKYA